MSKYLSVPYNHKAIFDQQVQPLMDQIHGICTEHKIPMLAMFCVSSEPVAGGARVDCVSSVSFHGEERTPREFVIAAGAPEGMESLMNRLAQDRLLEMLQRARAADDEDEGEEEGEAAAEGAAATEEAQPTAN